MLKPVQLGYICGGIQLDLKNDQRKLPHSISENSRSFSVFSGYVNSDGPVRLLEENLITFASAKTDLNDRRVLFLLGELTLLALTFISGYFWMIRLLTLCVVL